MIRITSGVFRGRSLFVPKSTKTTRPTQAKLRQALFNSVQAWLPGARVLDLFAGSGALGFEALSRGASQVVFLERDRAAVQLIQKNAAALGVENQVIIFSEGLGPEVGSSTGVLKRLIQKGPFDLVLADPPYADGWEEKLVHRFPWRELLEPEGLFCLEWGRVKSTVEDLPPETPSLQKVREKGYGDSMLSSYQLRSVTEGPELPSEESENHA